MVRRAVSPVIADRDKDGDPAVDVSVVDKLGSAGSATPDVVTGPAAEPSAAVDMIQKRLQREPVPWRLVPKVRQQSLGRRTRPERPVRDKGVKPGKGAKVRCISFVALVHG